MTWLCTWEGIRENGEARTSESQILLVVIPRAESSGGEAEREVANCGVRVVRKEINAVVSRCPAQVIPTPHILP